jgi:hypothetical protein
MRLKLRERESGKLKQRETLKRTEKLKETANEKRRYCLQMRRPAEELWHPETARLVWVLVLVLVWVTIHPRRCSCTCSRWAPQWGDNPGWGPTV